MKRLALTMALLLIATPAYSSVLENRTENFDVDPGWSVVGSGVNSNNFGYQAGSSFAGGTTGEGGGHFTRSNFIRYYGDTDLGGVIDLDDTFSASGKFDHTARNIPDFGRSLIIGHFSTGGLGKIGFNVTDNSTQGNLHWNPRIVLDDGTEIGGGPVVAITPNQDHTWLYSWNPDGGTNGGGLFTLTFDSTTTLYDLSPASRAKGLTLDAFGFSGAVNPGGTNRSNRFADMFIDDVTYSSASVIPEPTSFIVWSLLATFGIGVGWRRRRRLVV